MTDYTCPICGAEFAREYMHCAACGQHERGEHECPGAIDWVARHARAKAFLREKPKYRQPWNSKRYDSKE